jgi:hypothetical protein
MRGSDRTRTGTVYSQVKAGTYKARLRTSLVLRLRFSISQFDYFISLEFKIILRKVKLN